jgi:hypothetical protein
MKQILIIISLILLSSALFGQSDANDKEIRYKITSGLLWEPIGKIEKQSNNVGYVGPYKAGVPHGKGTMTYYDGRKIVGEFKRYAWNSTLYDKNGIILGKFVKGKYIKEKITLK